MEKRELLQLIVTECGRAPWRVRRFEEAPRDVLPSLTYVALQVLAGKDAGALLVVERPSEVLHAAPSQFFREIFGIEISPADSLPFDQNLLMTNRVPAVWVCSNISRLPDETIAQFLFHAPLKKADRSAQTQAVKRSLRKFRLGKAATAQILAFDGISSAQLASAVRAAHLIRHQKKADRDQAIVQAVRRSQRALSRDLADHYKPSVTHYSLEYLNTAGRFTPQQILKSFRPLRRFTFKIEFRELDSSQRWKMFLAEAGLTQTIADVDVRVKDKWEKRLLFMRRLTPGDFATVKRQCQVLDTVLTPDEWLEQLEIECEIKNAAPLAQAC